MLVCQGRAAAHGHLAPGRFDDPVAWQLLRPDERAVVEQAAVEPADGTPAEGGRRSPVEVQLVRACAELMVPRTVAVDAALAETTNHQVVLLGAGLDGRAWRMPWLGEATVYEVDHPATQADKRERSAALRPTARAVRFVPVDLRQQALGPALGRAGFDPARPATWVWEGVVPYLSEPEVARTVRQVGDLSASGSRLVVSYQVPSLAAPAGRLLLSLALRLQGRENPYGQEPHRSAWTARAMRELLVRYGFEVAWDADLLTLADGVDMEVHHRRQLRHGRIAVVDARD